MTKCVGMALAGAIVAVCMCSPARAGQVDVAVAANFMAPAKAIAEGFKRKTGDDAILSFGSAEQFYEEITQRAPFQVFLSADEMRPQKLVGDGLAEPSSLFVYAIGKLALWSSRPGMEAGAAMLGDATIAKVALCDPKAAPYGQAAIEALNGLKLYDALKGKLVIGADLTQALQFVKTGNAQVGFVALSQLNGLPGGSTWIVDQSLYHPIVQDAVLLKTGAANPAAREFMEYLKSPDARQLIKSFGYALDESP